MLAQILSEPSGQPSTMRVITLVAHVAFWGVWAALSIMAGRMIQIEEPVLLLLLGQSGLKLGQRWVEGKSSVATASQGGRKTLPTVELPTSRPAAAP
jgi:hypothetical protein